MNLSSFFRAITVVFHVVKLISILIAPFMLLTTVVAGFDMSALQSATEVVEHYQHHVNAHGETNLSVIEFLLAHFSTSAQPDAEHDELPLLGGLQSCGVTVIPVLGNRAISFIAPSSDVLFIPYAETSVTPTFAQSIFQPPRI